MKYLRLFTISSLFLLMVILMSACSGSGAVPASSWPGVSINQDTVYLAYNQFVYAINLESGTLKWSYPADKPDKTQSFYAAPVLTEKGDVIVGGYDKKLYKLNASNGSVIWVFDGAQNRYIASPLVTTNGIFAPNGDGNLYALDDNKNTLWNAFPTGKPLWAKPTTDSNCNCIYLPSMDHHLYAVDAKTGKELWQSPDLGGALVAEPTLDMDGTIYLGTFGKEMLALKTSTGEIKWRFATGGWVWSGARLVDGKLYFGDLKGNFYILDATSGAKISEELLDGPIASTPTVENNTIYFGTEAGTIYAYNLDGSRAWMKSIANIQKDNQPIGGKLYSPVVTAGDVILVAPAESKTFLVALDSNGEVKWLYSGK